jgi:hypothetical protein
MLEVAKWVPYCIGEFRWIGEFGRSGGKMRSEHFSPEDEGGDLLVALAMFHGIYNRVAAKAGVHHTMVSRVARGKRTSTMVLEAIREELRPIRDYLNRPPKKLNGG